MVIMHAMLIAAALAVPSLALAEAPPAPSEIRLSQAEIDQVLADAARKREARPQQHVDEEPQGRQVHGEVGFEVGSGGYRSVYGTTALELPDGGFAVLSFQTGRSRRDVDYYIPDDQQR